MKYLSARDFLWILPLSLGLGVILSLIQPGNWLVGWLAFSFLFLVSLALLTMSTRWASENGLPGPNARAGDTPREERAGLLDHRKILAWMVTLAFALRLIGGITTYLVLPINGYDDEDDRAGYTFTDAHRRDAQAWELASSDLLILNAFRASYAYDQYGGLLAFSAFIYRYFSPDAHRPLMLVLISAFVAALGLPFLWKAANRQWGGKIAIPSGWLYALYPESVLLGGSAMREPYLMAFSAFSLWGFVEWQNTHNKRHLTWLAVGIAGMLLVSPAVALFSLVIFAGWIYFTGERARIPAWAIVSMVLVFIVGLFVLSAALAREGNVGGGTPIGTISRFLRESVKWVTYEAERESGRVELIFEQFPEWVHVPFVVAYGALRPIVIPAFIEPTTLIWRIIAILRGVSWWMLLPVLILSFVAVADQRRRPEPVEGSGPSRKLWVWITVISWIWILFAALRGGGDLWDNPRYRAILFIWQVLAAAYAWVWWRETRSPWFGRILVMEGVLLAFFGEWYADRYFQIGGKMSFGPMVALIAGIWLVIFLIGWRRDRQREREVERVAKQFPQ